MFNTLLFIIIFIGGPIFFIVAFFQFLAHLKREGSKKYKEGRENGPVGRFFFRVFRACVISFAISTVFIMFTGIEPDFSFLTIAFIVGGAGIFALDVAILG